MNIWFVMDSIRWTQKRVDSVNQPGLGGGVGGTEAMTVGLCRHFAQRGHDVTLWTTKLDNPWREHGVFKWRPVESGLRKALLNEPSPDVIVAVRQPLVFSLPEMQGTSAHKLLWAGDVLERSQGYIPYLANVDTIAYVSDWQRRQWESVHEPLRTKFYSWVTPVALDPAWIVPGPHGRYTYIYASQPDRGLVPLLKMWKNIRERLPEATLLVTGYGAELSRIMILANRLIEQANQEIGGIELARSVDKPGYFAHLARARLMLYPGAYFEETNGHVCSEAMATGVVPLVSNLGALSETVPSSAGVLFDGDANSSEYQERYVDEVVRLSSFESDAEIALRRAIGYEHVIPRCTYGAICDLWEEQFRTLPVKRAIA